MHCIIILPVLYALYYNITLLYALYYNITRAVCSVL
jgi:hypothetical protein